MRRRIFFACSESADAVGLPGSRAWYRNLFLSLAGLGHDVVRFDYDLSPHFRNLNPSDPAQETFIQANRPVLEEALLTQVAAAHRDKPVDLFFSYFYSACARPQTIRQIRRMGIPTVNWYCNGAHQFHLVEEIAPAYDFCLVPERFRLDDYRRIGANPIYCQEAANPDVCKPYDLPREFDVTFVGQAYGDRPFLVRTILDHGVDIRVFGHGWDRFSSAAPRGEKRSRGAQALGACRRVFTRGGKADAASRLRSLVGSGSESVGGTGPPPVRLPAAALGGILSDEEMIRLYSRSRINLGFSSCGNTGVEGERILQVRLRDFEVPMSGGFYMVEYAEELEEFFRVGKEIVCYVGPEDLAEKVRYYLRHDGEREAIRKAGHERALRDHTWARRLEAAFRRMGMS